MIELTAAQIHAAHADAVGAVASIAVLGVEPRAMLDIRARVILRMAQHCGVLRVGRATPCRRRDGRHPHHRAI